MKKGFLISWALLSCLLMSAQATAFSHLEFAISAGTGGIGIDISTPLSSWLDIRGGFSFMPRIEASKTMSVIQAANGNGDMEELIDEVSGIFETLTGNPLQKEVTMNGRAGFAHGSLLFDVRPFKNRNWHFTAGCYIGSSQILSAQNGPECMNTLLAANTFNYYADKMNNPEVMDGNLPFFSFKGIEIYLDGDDICIHAPEYTDFDIYKPSDLTDATDKGKIGAVIGKKNGEEYRLIPDRQGMIAMKSTVNPIKPYVGFGYEGNLSRKTDKYRIGFDCGVLFWGGVPHLTDHSGTDITYEVTDYSGRIKGICNVLKSLPVYPVANLRLVRRIDFRK